MTLIVLYYIGYPSVTLASWKKVLCENKIGKYPHLHREVKKYAGRRRQEVKLILNKQPKLEPVYSV